MKKFGLLIRTILFAGFILSFIFIFTFTFAFSYTFAFSFAADDSRSIFTPEKRDWLDAHPVLYVAPDPNYAPVEFYKNDTFQGLSIDYLNWISDTYGIAFELSTGQINIALKSVEDMIYIHYRDYGTGISSQALPNIFEPFYSTKRGYEERLGLGLYSVYNIITQVLNGQIEALSEPDNGTTFQIKFPVNRALQ